MLHNCMAEEQRLKVISARVRAEKNQHFTDGLKVASDVAALTLACCYRAKCSVFGWRSIMPFKCQGHSSLLMPMISTRKRSECIFTASSVGPCAACWIRPSGMRCGAFSLVPYRVPPDLTGLVSQRIDRSCVKPDFVWNGVTVIVSRVAHAFSRVCVSWVG